MECVLNGKHVQDKGWCWVMFLCTNMIMSMIGGMTFSYGTLYPHFLKEFQQGEGTTAWIGSLSTGLLFLSSFPVIKFYNLTSAATTSLIGSVLSGVGLILTSYIQDFRWLYLTYSCMFGIGTSFMYMPIFIEIAKWFVKYRTVNTGIVSSCSALGAIVLSPLIQNIIENYGLRITLRSVGIFHTVISVICSLSYRPLQDVKKVNTIIMTKDFSSKDKKKNLLTNRSFMVFTFVTMVANLVYFIPLAHIVYYAETNMNVSPSRASFLISIWSISSATGRLIVSKLTSYNNQHTLRFYQFGLFLAGCVSILTTFANTYWLLVGYVVCYGLSDGPFSALNTLVILDLVGLKYLDQGIGIQLTCIGLPIAFGSPIIGFINDNKLLLPRSMFLLAGIPFILGSFLMIFVMKWKSLPDDEDAQKLLDITNKQVEVESNSNEIKTDENVLYISNI